jgi:hypothetical protein
MKVVSQPAGVLVTLGFVALTTALAPSERTLGTNLRLVLLHGAWVWTGIITFGAAALAGLAGLLLHRNQAHTWSLALGRTALLFWLTYLPMSLVVQQMNWGGIFWDEPRFRIPMMFGVVGMLLQTGLWMINLPRLSSAANFAFGTALVWQLLGAENILHPDSPVSQSGSWVIQASFAVLVALCLLLGVQIALWQFQRSQTLPQK